MTFSTPIEPIIADDAFIACALDDAELPALLAALAHLTGDLSILTSDLRSDPILITQPQGGLTIEQQAEIRARALHVLTTYRDAGCPSGATADRRRLTDLMEFATGTDGMDAYVPLLEEELAVATTDARAPHWTLADVAPGRTMNVVIIGAGMSGLLAGYRLKQAGISFVIVDKNNDIGGTWWENTYPGCRVDNHNHIYSYSFAQRHTWPQHYSPREVLWEYFRDCADQFGIRDHIRLQTEVRRADFDESTNQWHIEVRTADGVEELVADALISAVGQLNRPKFPDIGGRESFDGPSFHSARWDQDIDLAGKRVAVIGTGASAAQFIPIVAEQAAHVTVFQRTPNWLAPAPDYHQAVEDGQRWLYQHVPGFSQWHRFWMFWRSGDSALEAARVDPTWPVSEQSVGPANDFARMMLTGYLESEFGDRPDLLAKVVPSYPVAAKRILRDNGIWARTLKRDNVALVTADIVEITTTGVATADGVHHDVDVIIYGTGFQASRFLTPMTVTGLDGQDLHEQWNGDARAYLGVTIPNFPNFFCLYGPNTNIVINGSIIYFSECEVRYVMSCLETLASGEHDALVVRQDVHDDYNRSVDAENAKMAWGVSTVSSWYKNESGRVSQNWPFTLLDFWQRTLRVNPADYRWLGLGSGRSS